MEVFKGRPTSLEGRLDKEIRVYDMLDSLGIEYWRIDHKTANRIEECAEIDKALKTALCKNLFLYTRDKKDFYMLMMSASKRFDTSSVSRQIGSSRLQFADAEHMEEYLDITPGSVSVLGLMNDKEKNVKLLVDEDIYKSEYVGCHPCINTTSLRLKTKDVFGKILEFTEHDMTLVKV